MKARRTNTVTRLVSDRLTVLRQDHLLVQNDSTRPTLQTPVSLNNFKRAGLLDFLWVMNSCASSERTKPISHLLSSSTEFGSND